MFCLHAYLCTMCMQFPENQKRALGDRNRTQVLLLSNYCF